MWSGRETKIERFGSEQGSGYPTGSLDIGVRYLDMMESGHRDLGLLYMGTIMS